MVVNYPSYNLKMAGIPRTRIAKARLLGDKECSKCKVIRPLTAFRFRTDRTPNYTVTVCKDCEAIGKHRHEIKVRYGLSLEEYKEKLEAQDGLCKICGRPDPKGYKLSVDHDHKTQQVRDLLCGPCNMALGFFQDDQEILWKAIQYLDFWSKNGNCQ